MEGGAASTPQVLVPSDPGTVRGGGGEGHTSQAGHPGEGRGRGVEGKPLSIQDRLEPDEEERGRCPSSTALS